MDPNNPPKLTTRDNHNHNQHHRLSAIGMMENNNNTDNVGRMENKMIDLNSKPQRMHGQTSNNQVLLNS